MALAWPKVCLGFFIWLITIPIPNCLIQYNDKDLSIHCLANIKLHFCRYKILRWFMQPHLESQWRKPDSQPVNHQLRKLWAVTKTQKMESLCLSMGLSRLLVLLPCLALSPATELSIGNRIPTLCLTTQGQSCIFPFMYKDKTHTKCTYNTSPTPWCATRIYANTTVIPNRSVISKSNNNFIACPNRACYYKLRVCLCVCVCVYISVSHAWGIGI